MGWATEVVASRLARAAPCSPPCTMQQSQGSRGHFCLVPATVTCLSLSLDLFLWCDTIPTHHTGAIISNIAINPLS